MDFPPILQPVLVLGATGRIGTILRQAWPRGRGLWQARPGRLAPGPERVLLDPLGDPAALARAAAGAGAILCLAGVTPTTLAAAGPGAAMADNIALGLAAVRAAAQAGGGEGRAVPVLLASSSAVYGAQAGLLGETVPLAPVNDYGRAKAEMEGRAARLGAELGVAVTSLRIGNIAGADAILGRWQPGFALDRFADGRTPRRSYIGPLTLARVLERLCLTPDLPPLLNISAPGVVEMGALLDAAGLAWTPRPAPDSAIAEVALDVAALRALLPIGPATPQSLVAEWRAQSHNPA
ncbi:MAG: NAD-dependent epimerase/dehydratase family protein [Pseudodonghicola sp.]